MIQLEVMRYNPETDEKPRFQRYETPYKDDWVVLDALNYVKDEVDPTLSYRWSCHMAVCGSCGMMVNGEPMLACKAFLRALPRVIRVEPLAHFPVERDLVTGIDDFMAKLTRVKPWLIPGEDRKLPSGEQRQTPAELQRYHQYTQCINCMLCYAACPEYGLIPKFIGPAAIALGRLQRQEEVAAAEGVWECSFTGACSEVCPKHVDPAAALQQVKIAATFDWFQERLMPWTRK
jgi:fumarate reductase iron-sulfur subunit